MMVRYLVLSAAVVLAFSGSALAQQAGKCAAQVALLQNSLDSDATMKEDVEKMIEAHLDQAEALCSAGKEQESLEEVAKGMKLVKDNPQS